MFALVLSKPRISKIRTVLPFSLFQIIQVPTTQICPLLETGFGTYTIHLPLEGMSNLLLHLQILLYYQAHNKYVV